MPRPLQPIQLQILSILQSGQELTVRWDCGGDESFVYTAVNGEEQVFDYATPGNLAYGMELYLTSLLELPSAGEFEMSGTGRFFQEGTSVLLEYQSAAYVYEDDSWLEAFTDEELADMGYERPEPADSEEEKKEDSENEEEAEEGAQKPDKKMSAEYSGRRVLFSVS